MQIKTAVFPVAGLGTRFLPVTKVVSKEMLPILDKPLLQYAIDEAIQAGMEHIVFVISDAKQMIKDYFADVNSLQIDFVVQHDQLGLGHAVYCAKDFINDDYFAVILPDDYIYNENKLCLEQMLKFQEKNPGSVVAVEQVLPENVNKYGIVNIDDNKKILNIIEKPNPGPDVSTLAVVGRYILSRELFNYLEHQSKGAGGEIQITDAIATMMQNNNDCYAYNFIGTRYDCGSKAGWLQANIAAGLKEGLL